MELKPRVAATMSTPTNKTILLCSQIKHALHHTTESLMNICGQRYSMRRRTAEMKYDTLMVSMMVITPCCLSRSGSSTGIPSGPKASFLI